MKKFVVFLLLLSSLSFPLSLVGCGSDAKKKTIETQKDVPPKGEPKK